MDLVQKSHRKILFFAISRDLSTDKQDKTTPDRSGTRGCVIWANQKRILIKIVVMVFSFSILTSCQFPDLPIVFCNIQGPKSLTLNHMLQKNSSKSNFTWSVINGLQFSFFGYLHSYVIWWRHRYESYLKHSFIETLNGLLSHASKKIAQQHLGPLFRLI